MNRSGALSGRSSRVSSAAVLLFSLFVLSSCGSPNPTAEAIAPQDEVDVGSIVVKVYDGISQEAVDNVVIRVSNTQIVDGVDGRELRINGCPAGQLLVASAPGYETGSVPCNQDTTAYYIELNRLSVTDDPNYSWLSAENECGRCHKQEAGVGYAEFNEWKLSAHATVFADSLFETIYRGVNVNGLNVAPGFKLDKPTDAGNCAFCHAPAAIPFSGVPQDLSSDPAGAGAEGVTCDVCHKASGIVLDNAGNPLKYGALSFEYLRSNNLFVIGSFSNVLSAGNSQFRQHTISTCKPFLSRSVFCAACHYGMLGGTLIYGSYSEWQASDYGKDPKSAEYRTCQDCHMSHLNPKKGLDGSPSRNACSETKGDFQDYSHNLMDFGEANLGNGTTGQIPRMIQEAADLDVKVKYDRGARSLNVRVTVENTKAGHKFPTDSPLRHLILVVNVTDEFGHRLERMDGLEIPEWTGDVNMNLGGVPGYAGLPGTVYANLLKESSTDVSPTASYWRDDITHLYTTKNGRSSDTCLMPNDPEVTEYNFHVPDLGEVKINVQLIYRFAFFKLMDEKDWVRPDILVTQTSCQFSPTDGKKMDCRQADP